MNQQTRRVSSWSTAIFVVIVISLVFTYVDLGLTSNRVPLILGVILGTVGVLDRIKD